MTDQTTSDGDSPLEALPDLESLIEREDVPFDEQPEVVEHRHHFDVYEPIAGMAVVGVTNREGAVLLMVRDDEPVAILPHGPVEPGEDWTTAASRAVEERTGVAIEIDSVERVKRKYFAPEGDDDRRTTAYQVFLRASPATDAAIANGRDDSDERDWNVGWFEEVPVDTNEEVVDDIRSFVD